MEHRITSYLLTTMLLITLTAMVSCNDNSTSSDPDSNKPPDDTTNPNLVSKEIGDAGGEITSTDNRVTLSIPAGALDGAEIITIEKIEEGELGPEFDELSDLLGFQNALQVGPDGLQFNIPVTVRIQSDRLLVHSEDSLGVFAEFLFTSENGLAAPLDSLKMEANAGQNRAILSGQL